MMSIYTGRPGSGKSLHACRDIRDALKYKKIPVIANFEIGVEREDWSSRVTYLPNSGITADYLVGFARDYWSGRKFKEDGILLVLDEAQLLYNSRLWNESGRMEMLQFYSQHRKYGYKVILIAQSFDMIDKQFRTLIEYEVNHRKVSNYGLWGAVMRLVAFGEIFYACRYYALSHTKLDGQFFRYSRKVARMYNSYSTFEMGARDANAARAVTSMVESAGGNHEYMNAGEGYESQGYRKAQGAALYI